MIKIEIAESLHFKYNSVQDLFFNKSGFINEINDNSKKIY